MKVTIPIYVEQVEITRAIGRLPMEDLISIRKFIDNILIGLDNFNFTKDEYQMLDKGEKINLIKSIRERTGFGLSEAKQLSEKWDALRSDYSVSFGKWR